MSETSDRDRIRAVLAGDPQEYALLVDRYQGRLFGRALALTGDADLAADMVQETFIRAYHGLATADPDRFGAWINRILRNLCLDELRSARRRTTSLPAHLKAKSDPERELDRRELGDAIDVALNALGPTVREAFVMKHVEGLSYDEMAALTGVAVGALKMRVKRARETLQNRLRPMQRDPAM
jgi:RNA polymerase sigma-70 factor, ECF subfamily